MMQNFDVYGLGNALLDVVYQVSEDFLTTHHLQKGRMALVDEATLQEMQNWELPTPQMSSGGSAANSMIALAMLGGTAYYACQVAPDDAGKTYLSDLQKVGVTPPGLPDATNYQGPLTGRCIVLVTPDAERTMYTYLGACTNLEANLIQAKDLQQAQVVYLEGYLTAQPGALKAIRQAVQLAKDFHKPLALTFSDVNIIEQHRAVLDEIIQSKKLAYLFCNEQEALAYTNTADLKSAAKHLQMCATQVAITLGPQGVYLVPEDKLIKAPQVNAIDTNGAGDMFAGCFLYGITHQWPLEKAAELGCAAAAYLTTQYGARLSQEDLLQQKQIIAKNL